MSEQQKAECTEIARIFEALPSEGKIAALSYTNGYADGFIAGKKNDEIDEHAEG